MPKYAYGCTVCGRIEVELRPIGERDRIDPCTDNKCEGILQRGFSKVAEPTVMETADQRRNVQWRKNQTERLKKRAKDFFLKNEMGDAIAKAGKQEAERLGWIDKKTGKKNTGK